MLCQQEYAGFQSVFIERIMGQLKDKLPSICPAEIEKYIYEFLIYGCLQVIREWISSDFSPPENEIADLIYQLCNRIYLTAD